MGRTKGGCMRANIRAVGNTRADAEKELQKKRDAIWDKNPDIPFSEIREYGNFEQGYRLVQDYGK